MSLLEKINKTLDEYELKLLSEPENLKINSSIIEYKCYCGNEFKKTVKQFLKVPENNCCKEKKQKLNFEKQPEERIENGLTWKKFENIYVSNTGMAKSMYEKDLVMDSKYRYFVDNKHQYVSRIMAFAFNIEGHENLNSQKYVVSFKDGNNSNFNLNNLEVVSKSEVNKKNGLKSRQSQEFKQAMEKDITYYLMNIPYTTHKFFPNYIFFEDGNIYNNKAGAGGKRFLVGSKNKTESYLNISYGDINYKFHRLVCMAFHPIEGKETYDDYKDLQVNHKDGNKLNNHKDNLEWVTQSENINHSYETKLNKKVRAVIQYKNNDGEYGEVIKEFPSLSKASRETKIPEHEIREIAKGKIKFLNNKQFLWKYRDEEDTENYRQKFSSKLADRN